MTDTVSLYGFSTPSAPVTSTSPKFNALSDAVTSLTYKYKPLLERNWFRILRLLPGSNNEPISTELFAVELEQAPEYNAISYVWGDLIDPVAIICNGLPLWIQSSLFAALTRFRHETEPRLLWADAVCINQSDGTEKGHQVDLMGKIYARAHTVLVWLGEDTNHIAHLAFQHIKAYNQHIRDELQAIVQCEKVGWSLRRIAPLPAHHPLKTDVVAWMACHRLLHLPWFARAWVLQEVGVAQRCVAYLGISGIPFSEVVLFYLLLGASRRVDKPKDIKFSTRDMISTYSRLWAGYSSVCSRTWMKADSKILQSKAEEFCADSHFTSFLEVLNQGRNFDCSDARDHVYAFLGHPSITSSNTTKRLSLEANYHINVCELNLQIAAKLSILTQAKILRYVQNVTEEDISQLSWVPQWHQSRSSRFRGDSYLDSCLSAATDGEISVVISGTVMTVRGLRIDRVHIRSGVLNLRTMSESSWLKALGDSSYPVQNAHSRANLVLQCWDICQHAEQRHSSYYHTKSSRVRALIDTLTNGAYPPQRSREADFRDLCQNASRLHKLHGTRLSLCDNEDIHENDDSDGADNIVEDHESGRGFMFYENVARKMNDRQFFVTHGGRYGSGPQLLAHNDLICLVFGCKLPFIIRPTGAPSEYHFIGECFISGLESGQAISEDPNWRGKIEGFSFI